MAFSKNLRLMIINYCSSTVSTVCSFALQVMALRLATALHNEKQPLCQMPCLTQRLQNLVQCGADYSKVISLLTVLPTRFDMVITKEP
jgi:hypothetical protein